MFEPALAKRPLVHNNPAMKRIAWLAMSAGLTVTSCLSGQTGSADCVPGPVSCQCEGFAQKIVIEATLLSVDASQQATLEIETVLNPKSYFGANTVHRKVIGSFSTGLPCEAARETPRVGDTVFAAFYPWNDTGSGDIAAALLILPWTDAIELGNGTAVPLSEVVELTDSAKCDLRYPPPAHEPCRDTSYIGLCTLPAAPASRSNSPWLAALALTALVHLRRRRTPPKGHPPRSWVNGHSPRNPRA